HSMALQARISVHQSTSANARMKRLEQDSGEDGADVEMQLINAAMRDEGGLLRTGHGSALAGAMGPSVLMNALRMSLAGGYPQVAAAICDELMYVDSFGEIYEQYLANAAPSEELEIGGGEEGEDADDDDDEDEDSEMEALEDAMEAAMSRFLAPLFMAVKADNESVRYSAARALMRLAHGLEHPEMGRVHATFATALQQSSMKNIIVIATDEGVRTQVRDAINSGTTYNVVTFNNVEAGLRQITQSPIYDAVIIATSDAAMGVDVYVPNAKSSGRGDDTTTQRDTAYGVLTADVGARNIPRIFIGDSSDLSGVTGDALTVIQDAESADAIREELMRAVGEESGQDASNAFVIEACNVVRSFNPNHSELDMNSVARALALSLGSPDDTDPSRATPNVSRAARSTEARVALAQALAHVASYHALSSGTADTIVGNLGAILGTTDSADGKDTAAVREACANALGELMRHHQDRDGFGGYRTQVRNALEKAMRLSGSDMDTQRARNAAGRNLGKLKLTAMEVADMTDRNRAANYNADNSSAD
ncbi:MAG: hypothetical protein KDB07_05210, partial [Planctomycetes bacterium]|nr:hypothetical protein [Planctomycetota bacterium]